MKDQLTNEALKKLFKNNFELAQYAIRVARYFVKSGHEVNVDELLRDIQKNPDLYRIEELEAMEKADSMTEEVSETKPS
jgi:hypothetical protein